MMSEQSFILDPTSPLTPEALQKRKQEVKEKLLETSVYGFDKAYQPGMAFARRVDRFVEDFQVPTANEGPDAQFKGGINLLNSVRIDALINAVDASSLRLIGAGPAPYIKALGQLRPEERQFVRQSKDWETKVTEKLEDGGGDFYERL